MIDIPVKNGKGVTLIMTEKEEAEIKKLAAEILEKEGRYSKAEAARRLIAEGARSFAEKKKK